MEKSAWLSLSILCLSFLEISTVPQQAVTANPTNGTKSNSTWDLFLDEDELEKGYPYVTTVKFHLKEDTLIEFFTRLAMLDVECPVPACNITLADIIDATQIPRRSTDDIADAIGTMRIGGDDAYNILLLYKINATIVQELLEKFDFTFSEIYNNFVKTLDNPSQTIPDILNILNVSLSDFMTAQVYGNDTERIRVLSTGNYSQKNLNDILNITGKTGLDLLKTIPLNVTARKIRNVNEYEFLNFVKNLGVNSNNLQNFYKHLNITHINFLTYPAFINVVTGIYDHLNSEEVLGVAISPTKVITSNKSKVLLTYKNQGTELVRRYAKCSVELVENPLVQHAVKRVSFLNPEFQSGDVALVETSTPFTVYTTAISKNYSSSTLYNCSYISKLPFEGIYYENVSSVRMDSNLTITMTKTSETIYNLGSPLFCQDKLCGIATQEGNSYIKFSTLIKSASGTTKPGVPGVSTHPTTSTEKSLGVIVSYRVFNFVIVLVAVIMYY